MGRHMFAVLTNPVDGREAEFNDWYDNRHVHDIVKLPGIVSAQRFKLSAEQSAATPYRYLVLYEIDTNDLAATIRELRPRMARTKLLARRHWQAACWQVFSNPLARL